MNHSVCRQKFSYPTDVRRNLQGTKERSCKNVNLHHNSLQSCDKPTNAHFTNMFNHILLFVANTFRSLLCPPSVCLIETTQSTHKLHARYWLYSCFTTAWWWSRVWPTDVGKKNNNMWLKIFIKCAFFGSPCKCKALCNARTRNT
jgi:hypothetical protein